MDKFEAKSAKGIEYERLSEFFFDLCLSWCQFLDVETFLFFINGVFLNITRGQHVNVSVFRGIEDIPTLSIEFFNHLLAYRAACADAVERGQSYSTWYRHNFMRTHAVAASAERNLLDSFKDVKDEQRILDIWIDLPPQIVNQYLDQHFNRMERDIAKVDLATKTRQRLVDSIKFMEQVKVVASFKPTTTRTHKVYG